MTNNKESDDQKPDGMWSWCACSPPTDDSADKSSETSARGEGNNTAAHTDSSWGPRTDNAARESTPLSPLKARSVSGATVLRRNVPLT